jgi:hypothetical protein
MNKTSLSKKIKIAAGFGVLATCIIASLAIGANHFKNSQFENFDLGEFQ